MCMPDQLSVQGIIPVNRWHYEDVWWYAARTGSAGMRAKCKVEQVDLQDSIDAIQML